MRADPEQGPGLGEAGAYWQLRAAEWLGMRLPRAAGVALGDALMRAQMRRNPRQRAVVAGNLARVLGHPPDSPLVHRAVVECYRLYGRYWYETFALRTMPVDELSRRFRLDGLEHVDGALARGVGIVLALPHMGNWDAAGHWLAVNGYRLTAVAEELKPRRVYELFFRHRRALGIGIVPLTSAGNTGARLVELLSQNEIITLVADRDLTGRGVRVEMFGAPRLLPAGPAYLALATGTPLCSARVVTTRDGWHATIDAPLEIEPTGQMRADVTALTRLLASRFERAISSAPTDWHMFQPAWDDLPDGAGAGERPEATAATAPP